MSWNTFLPFGERTWVLTDCCPGKKSQSTPLSSFSPSVMNSCYPHLYLVERAPLDITDRELLCCGRSGLDVVSVEVEHALLRKSCVSLPFDKYFWVDVFPKWKVWEFELGFDVVKVEDVRNAV